MVLPGDDTHPIRQEHLNDPTPPGNRTAELCLMLMLKVSLLTLVVLELLPTLIFIL